MFAQIFRSFQFRVAMAALLPAVLAAPVLAQDDGFLAAGDYPWIGWYGPVADGLYGLRFGTGAFEVSEKMEAKGLRTSHPRPYTLRFEGRILGEQGGLVAEFTTARPGAKESRLRAVQIRWILRGLPKGPLKLFDSLDQMLHQRYGEPVDSRQDGPAALENGRGVYHRLFYGPEARALLELEALGQLEYSLVIRIECPQLPDPREQEG
jgi:hypothetical protein